jgi:hypothetical protein
MQNKTQVQTLKQNPVIKKILEMRIQVSSSNSTAVLLDFSNRHDYRVY